MIADLEADQRAYREQITLLKAPGLTLYLFGCGTLVLISSSFHYCVAHPLFLYLLLPALLLWIVLEHVPGPLTPYIDFVEFCIQFFIWWVGLGILSSVGLGSGLQSGVLFLYPHIIKVFFAAQTCKTLDFESASDMWFRKPRGLFKCPSLQYESTPVTFWGTWLKIIPACFLQALGTALGEIPPYWMTRSARLAAIEAGTSSAEDIPEELQSDSTFSLINRGKTWMIRFLRNQGFWGILLMASFPNIAFDLCGICCGHFLMPFWTFLGATIIGKAIIRNGYQSVVYVALCSEKYLELLIQLLQRLAPDGLNIDQLIREVLEETKSSFENMSKGEIKKKSTVGEATPGEIFFFYWQILMVALLMAFLLSCISHFAQYYQLILDTEVSRKLRSRLPSRYMGNEFTSPKSGRLILPPPTPAVRKGVKRE